MSCIFWELMDKSISPTCISSSSAIEFSTTLVILLEKEKEGEVVISCEEGSSKEEVIRNNIEICRNFVEINFLNK